MRCFISCVLIFVICLPVVLLLVTHSKLYSQGLQFGSHLHGATSWGPSIVSALNLGFPWMLPHPGCSGDDTLYPAHFTAVSVDKQNLGHPVKYFNMCSVCLFTCKCATSCTCSRAFYLLKKTFSEKTTNCSEPKLQQPGAKHYSWLFFPQVSVDKFGWFSTINRFILNYLRDLLG